VSATQGVTAGSILAGKYRVTRLLGQGGMGVVVEAQHISLDDRVALKFLLPEYASHPQAAERFLREARAAVKIKGAHVARVSDVGALEDGSPYMVMEYLDGSDAAKLLASQGPLPLPEAIDWVVQASDAIAEAHGLGIVHRDLKPANLFVTRHQDGTAFIKVLDFGISKLISDTGEALTRTNASMGSALYMSPEQIRQARSVDHRTDVYALGITLFELLSGRQPFAGESFSALCVEIATGTPTPLGAFRTDLPPDVVRATADAAHHRAHRTFRRRVTATCSPTARSSTTCTSARPPLVHTCVLAAGWCGRGARRRDRRRRRREPVPARRGHGRGAERESGPDVARHDPRVAERAQRAERTDTTGYAGQGVEARQRPARHGENATGCGRCPSRPDGSAHDGRWRAGDQRHCREHDQARYCHCRTEAPHVTRGDLQTHPQEDDRPAAVNLGEYSRISFIKGVGQIASQRSILEV
jgi:tRNA A-37 threonylcarbamoyl transferase component Bud32